jgi:PAS domain S-box-containing protein
MLADVLDAGRRQVVDELERRERQLEPPRSGRRAQLTALVDDLVETLKRGRSDEPPTPHIAPTNGTSDRSEVELVRNYVVEEAEHHDWEASPAELVLVSDWCSSADLRRLSHENEQLSALLNDVEESTVVVAPDGRVLYLNRRAAQGLHDVTGLQPDQIIGRIYTELGVHDELGISRSPEELLTLARAGDSFEVTAWGRERKNKVSAVYAPDGTVSGVVSVIQDIHGRKMAEKRVDLLSKLGMLVGKVDYDKVAEALAHVPIPELADWCAVNIIQDGKISRTFIAQRDPAKARLRDAVRRAILQWGRHPLWQEMLTSGFQLLGEVTDELVRKLAANDEQYRLLSELKIRSLMVVPLVVRGEDAGIMTLFYTAESGRRYGRDDPMLAEELALHAAHTLENARLMSEVRSSEARFRIALAAARTVVYQQDRSLRYVSYYNPLVAGSRVGKTEEDIMPHEEAVELRRMKRCVLDTGESVTEEMDLTVAGDERRHFRLAVEPIRDEAGAILGIVGAATDITEQQRSQQQLSETLEFREQMMGILGHDLRNPLGAITMASDALMRRSDLPADAHELARVIRHASDRMDEMIRTLLDFARTRFLGVLPILPVPTDLGDISRAVIEELRAASPEREIDLQVGGDVRGDWDPSRMSQMLSNLIGNASSYGAPGTPVRVSVQGRDDTVTLEVTNQGPPISPEILPVVFDPFRRGSHQDVSPRGLGLGLYIARQIVLAHHGTIRVASTAQDGTIFTVELPRHAASPAVSDEPRRALARSSTTPSGGRPLA